MKSFTLELVSNASAHFCKTIHSASLQTFCWTRKIRRGNEGLQFRKYPTHQCTKMWEGKLMFFDTKPSNSTEFNYLELCLCPSITDIVGTMNTLLQGRHNHIESCITVQVYRKLQKIHIYPANGASGLAFFSTDLGLFLRATSAINFEFCWEEKIWQARIWRTTSSACTLMMYANAIGYIFVGDTKALLLRCLLFFHS